MDNQQKKKDKSQTNYDTLLTSAKNEYDQSFKHREKLDAKINIIFTVYAFMILIYIQLISSIEKDTVEGIKELILELLNNKIVDVKLFLFSIGFAVSTILIIYNVLSLLSILKGVSLEHFDSSEILNRNLFEENEKANAKFITALYEGCKSRNNSIINNKFLEYNDTTDRTIAMIIAIIFTYLLKIIL